MRSEDACQVRMLVKLCMIFLNRRNSGGARFHVARHPKCSHSQSLVLVLCFLENLIRQNDNPKKNRILQICLYGVNTELGRFTFQQSKSRFQNWIFILLFHFLKS